MTHQTRKCIFTDYFVAEFPTSLTKTDPIKGIGYLKRRNIWRANSKEVDISVVIDKAPNQQAKHNQTDQY
jgi:hypothetical protein